MSDIRIRRAHSKPLTEARKDAARMAKQLKKDTSRMPPSDAGGDARHDRDVEPHERDSLLSDATTTGW